MADTFKALLFCVLAQALLVARQRLVPIYFGGVGVLPLTAVASAGFGALVLAATWSQVKSQLKPKPVVLAALTALFGVALAETLSLTGRQYTTAAAVQLSSYAIPLVVILVTLVAKIEPLDRWSLAALVLGIVSVAVGSAGTDVATELLTSEQGLGYLLAAALATACFLVSGQKLIQASSLPFAVASVMVLGGGMLGYMARDQIGDAWSDAVASSGGFIGLLSYAAAGLAAVYALLFASLTRIKLTAVGASFLLAAPCSVLFLYLAHGREPTVAALLGAGGALAAFGVVFARAK